MMMTKQKTSLAERLNIGDEVRELKLGCTFNPKNTTNAFHTIKYDFKPASVDKSKIATVDVGSNNQVTVTVPNLVSSGVPHTVYKGNHRKYTKECLIIYDKITGDITLEQLNHNIQVKKTRSEMTNKTSGAIASAVPQSKMENSTMRVSTKTKVSTGSRRNNIIDFKPRNSPMQSSPSRTTTQHKSPQSAPAWNANNAQSTLPSIPMIVDDDDSMLGLSVGANSMKSGNNGVVGSHNNSSSSSNCNSMPQTSMNGIHEYNMPTQHSQQRQQQHQQQNQHQQQQQQQNNYQQNQQSNRLLTNGHSSPYNHNNNKNNNINNHNNNNNNNNHNNNNDINFLGDKISSQFEVGVLSSSSSSSESDSSGSDSGSDSDSDDDNDDAPSTMQQNNYNHQMNQLPNLGAMPMNPHQSQHQQQHNHHNGQVLSFGNNGAFPDDLLQNDLQLSSNSSDEDD